MIQNLKPFNMSTIYFMIRLKRYLLCAVLCACVVAGCTRDDFDENATGHDSIINGDGNTIVEGQNLLTNGGLEIWGSAAVPKPEGWSVSNNGFVRRDSITRIEGAFSAKMKSEESGNTARLEQLIPVTPGQKIRIRFSYYIEQWKSKGARTYCYFRTRKAEASNLSAEELHLFYSDAEYYIIRGGGYGLTYFPHELDVWQTFDETITVPPTANYFVFGINSYLGTTLYVDDCFVTAVSTL
jgi:hypothetical protein